MVLAGIGGLRAPRRVRTPSPTVERDALHRKVRALHCQVRALHCQARVITGAHSIIYSTDPDGVRAFFRDVLGLPSVDAGHGWLIFALPPAEVAAHPTDGAGRHELYLMCDDIQATVEELRGKGVELTRPIAEERWGLVTAIGLPGGGELGLYEPRHPTPPH